MLGKDPDKVNEAVERMTEARRDSYEAARENTAAMQETNNRLAWSLFESNIELLLGLSRESLNAYDGFLDSLSSYYEEVSEEPERFDR